MVVFEGKNNCSQALPKKYRLVKYSYSIVGLLWFIMIPCLFSFRSDPHVRYVLGISALNSSHLFPVPTDHLEIDTLQ